MSALPAWQEVDRLFQRHGLTPPPYRLRDELVGWLLAYRTPPEGSATTSTSVGDGTKGEALGQPNTESTPS